MCDLGDPIFENQVERDLFRVISDLVEKGMEGLIRDVQKYLEVEDGDFAAGYFFGPFANGDAYTVTGLGSLKNAMRITLMDYARAELKPVVSYSVFTIPPGSKVEVERVGDDLVLKVKR